MQNEIAPRTTVEATPLNVAATTTVPENEPIQIPKENGGYHILTWGCQMNEEDSEQMGLYLEGMGYQHVADVSQADVVLLNTCSVRAKPEEKVWSELGRLKEMKQRRPEMLIGVCGCMAQVESEAIRKRAPYVDLVVGTGNISAIPTLVRRARGEDVPEDREADEKDASGLIPIRLVSSFPRPVRPTPAESVTEASTVTESVDGRLMPVALLVPRRYIPGAPGPSRTLTALELPDRKGAIVSDIPQRAAGRRPKLKAHVPIMYGCDKFCTFCIVPFTRGRERSRPTDEILREISEMARGGTREVTLLGQTVNSYGKNLPEGRVPFCDLLTEINAIRGLQRIRFTSPYPRDFTDNLIESIGRLEKVCEHVHLPLQVGDDELLTEMHRGYTVARFREIVEKLRANVPGIAITTDIMLGYPGETDAQVENTLRFVREIRFDAAFMFAYSPRKGTKAAAMEIQIPQNDKMARLGALIELQNGITCDINASQVGKTFEILVEGRSQKDPNKLSGFSRTLKSVNFTVPTDGPRSPESLIGKTVPVLATEAHLTGFTGVYVG